MTRYDRPSKASLQRPGMSHFPVNGLALGHPDTSASFFTSFFVFFFSPVYWKEEHHFLLFASYVGLILKIVRMFRIMV